MKTPSTLAATSFLAPAPALTTHTAVRERAQAYEFLAGIFLKEPSEEILAELCKWAKASSEDEILPLLTNISTTDYLLEDLKQEYYDLFFVPVSGRFVPPFESAIVTASRRAGEKTKFGFFWGAETTEISQLYKRTEFHPEQLTIFEPLREINIPDHLGFELSFMAYLYRLHTNHKNRGLSTSGIRQLEAFFLDRHLNRWLPLFVADLEQVTQSGYYLYFARLARTLCQEDASDLRSSGS